MHILVTAGNTPMPIDKVRCITNIFTGRTGTKIALEAKERGHEVTLLTCHPELVPSSMKTAEGGKRHKEAVPEDSSDLSIPDAATSRWSLRSYRTFEELENEMEHAIRSGAVDAVIHCAAVSDYRAAGIYALAPGTQFRQADGRWTASGYPALEDKSAGKVKSDEPELWLRLLRTPKLVDRLRRDWHFQGLLVKFKLEVGVEESQLLEIAEQSRRRSAADLMVANTLETMRQWAYIGPIGGKYQQVRRAELGSRLLEAVEKLYEERE
jgi:phosphopantothenate-cysteine ligase/phosphopantothenoylcysteine decarboxylase/phosphopantothenate--cysteine ligase